MRAMAALLLSVELACLGGVWAVSPARAEPSAHKDKHAPAQAGEHGSEHGLEKAESALRHGEYAAALALLEPLAQRDRPRALALLGQLHALRGERPKAERAFRRLIALYNDDKISDDDGQGLWAVAEAAHGLGSFRDANDAFARAVKASPDDFAIELAWVDLFLEKYDTSNAETGLERVLAQASPAPSSPAPSLPPLPPGEDRGA